VALPPLQIADRSLQFFLAEFWGLTMASESTRASACTASGVELAAAERFDVPRSVTAVPEPSREQSPVAASAAADAADSSKAAHQVPELCDASSPYCNKLDNRLFVPKDPRWFGWAVNLGHPWGPAVYLAPIAVPVVVALAVAVHPRTWRRIAKALR